MGKQMSVLIADSSEEFCAQLKDKLQALGYAVMPTAADGQQAVTCMESQRPDIIILDLMLPKLDGIAVLKAAAKLQPRPACLVMSAFVTDYVAATVSNLGALLRRPDAGGRCHPAPGRPPAGIKNCMKSGKTPRARLLPGPGRVLRSYAISVTL